jgi:hypothetical protein
MGEYNSVLGCGTMLQAGRSRIQFPMDFSIDFINHSSCTMALGLIQPLTEMITRNLPGVKGWPVHKADNITTMCEPMVKKMCKP